MLGRVVVENGVKKIVPLTADCGSGNPCGAIITVYQRTVPNGYLPLGAQYDITQFPVLYSILGTDTIPTASALGLPTLTTGQYVIKATSGINENQADNVLSALSPVDVVALNNVHSVTSNAVAQALQNKVLNEWRVLCRHGQKTYIHRDVATSGDNPKWIKLIIYFHSSYNTGTAVSEYLVRLNYTPYRNTDYRGLTYKLIAGIEANDTDYDVLANQFGSLGWDSDGIYVTNNSSFADFSTTVISLYDRTA